MFRLTAFGGLVLARDGQVLGGAAARRRPLGLLALLAAACERGLTRDKAVAYFWPEGDTDRSRHALAQTLYSLRQDLGNEVVVASANDLRLNPTTITTDVWDFEAALASGDAGRAAALFAGPFLDGFYVGDAPAFERWVEEERTQYNHRYRQLVEEQARKASSSGDDRAAVEWWRRAVRTDPLDARLALAYMEALAAVGDAAAAIRHARVHEQLVRQELKLPPDEALRRYVRELRDKGEQPASAGRPREIGAVATQPSPQPTPAWPPYRSTPLRMLEATTVEPEPASTPQPSAAPAIGPVNRRSRRALLFTSAAVLLSVSLGIVARQHNGSADAAPVLAVGTIREFGGGDTAKLAPALGEMLSTNVARIPRTHTISNARIYEFVSQAQTDGPLERRVENAALRAGATELLDGSLYLEPGATMRFDLRRVDIATGTVRRAYSVRGRDLATLVDSATQQLARDLDVRAEVLRIGDVTTTSVMALRFYDEGLRALYQGGDGLAALRLFQLALREDSTFAMAAYYVARVGQALGDSSAVSAELQSLRQAKHASEHERLLINAVIRVSQNDPTGALYAESLATRFPREPDGFVAWAGSKIEGGDFLGAVPLLRRVIVMDSTSMRRETVSKGLPCGACVAYGSLIEAYWRADSLDAMVRVAREVVQRQPWSSGAIAQLGKALEHAGRYDEAEKEFARASDSASAGRFDPWDRIEFLMNAGRFPEADQLLEAFTAGRDERIPERGAALWWLAIERRMEGRLRDAERAARRNIVLWRSNFEIFEVYGQILIEEGRDREAARIFDSLAAHSAYPPEMPTRVARQHAWYLAHLVTALAALGDTARLRPLCDTLEMLGKESSYGRDRLLYHYARGLLYRARHHDDAAIDELRLAVYSPTIGYTRVNYELGKLLLAHGRAEEAVQAVRPALFGPLEAASGYITRTELHELLAQAFDAMHQPDSAAVHYRWLTNAWRGADPQFKRRYEIAQARLSSLAR